ncbi:hypothetical protein VTO73DRAFT_423 [Trametes versicolor]
MNKTILIHLTEISRVAYPSQNRDSEDRLHVLFFLQSFRMSQEPGRILSSKLTGNQGRKRVGGPIALRLLRELLRLDANSYDAMP